MVYNLEVCIIETKGGRSEFRVAFCNIENIFHNANNSFEGFNINELYLSMYFSNSKVFYEKLDAIDEFNRISPIGYNEFIIKIDREFPKISSKDAIEKIKKYVKEITYSQLKKLEE